VESGRTREVLSVLGGPKMILQKLLVDLNRGLDNNNQSDLDSRLSLFGSLPPHFCEGYQLSTLFLLYLKEKILIMMFFLGWLAKLISLYVNQPSSYYIGSFLSYSSMIIFLASVFRNFTTLERFQSFI
jgi:hypothetical protein